MKMQDLEILTSHGQLKNSRRSEAILDQTCENARICSMT
jgi:hypothetical protein